MSAPDTIFALSSAPGRAGVAVVRLSGPDSLKVLQELADIHAPQARQMVFAALSHKGRLIDRALAVYFKAPASFTGEDVVEFHVHGGTSVVESLLHALAQMPRCRMAEAGEFTKRAFQNEKLDLTEAEAIADLIAAETEAQRLQALDQLSGSLKNIYQDWSNRLSGYLAHQEAEIEFPDEDLPNGIAQELNAQIKKLSEEITGHLQDNNRGERLRSGARIAIIGAPNAGKSSLLNALAARDVAIVSPEAGTTRDVIETHLDLGGYPVIVFDTAGLRESNNAIELEGIKRARKAAADADFKIALFAPDVDNTETQSLTDDQTIIVHNKKDLKDESGVLCLSTKTGEGLQDLIDVLTNRVKNFFTLGRPAPTRQRHRQHLQKALEPLQRSLSANLPELAAEDLRLALRELGAITGRVHVEDILDRVFKDFCIGK